MIYKLKKSNQNTIHQIKELIRAFNHLTEK